jgi:sulfofructose kinase
VTLGARGYLWAERDGRTGHQPAFQVDVVDTTGAGDAFHGAFALGVAEALPIEANVRRAAAVAALKCTRLGSRAGLPTRSELELFIALHDS